MSQKIKVITKNWGKVDPRKIESYEKSGGYSALSLFLKDSDPKRVIEEIKKSGLRGRGGAGYLTGEKWELVAKAESSKKYFICNLEESEPGTYKDRMIVDNDPHLLLEGIIISSIAIGAKSAFIYINGNYKKQLETLERAIFQAKSRGYLGKNILGSRNNLELEIFSGAGAYICGEETALINSMEGRRGEPKMRPPYPTEAGLFGKPTVVNNAETVANIPWIISYGSEEFIALGSKNFPGTKLYCISGSVKRPGAYEAPGGTSIRDLIFKIGGGMKDDKEFWFAQVGGTCGKLLLEDDLDARPGFSGKCDCALGSGSILVVPKDMNIYDMLVSWTKFYRRESCGKCIPCREGTFRMYEIMKRFQDGKISDRDKIAVRDILWTLENTTFCPFGKFAAVAAREAVEKRLIEI